MSNRKLHLIVLACIIFLLDIYKYIIARRGHCKLIGQGIQGKEGVCFWDMIIKQVKSQEEGDFGDLWVDILSLSGQWGSWVDISERPWFSRIDMPLIQRRDLGLEYGFRRCGPGVKIWECLRLLEEGWLGMAFQGCAWAPPAGLCLHTLCHVLLMMVVFWGFSLNVQRKMKQTNIPWDISLSSWGLAEDYAGAWGARSSSHGRGEWKPMAHEWRDQWAAARGEAGSLCWVGETKHLQVSGFIKYICSL